MAATTETNGSSDDQAVPLDDEAKQLKLQQTKAESRKAIAQAEKDRLAAMLPTGEVKPNGGKIDIGANVGLVADLLSHQLLDAGAAKLAADVQASVAGQRVLVVDDMALMATDWPFTFISTELENQGTALKDIVDALKRLIEPTEPAPVETKRDRFAIQEYLLPAAIPALLSLAPSVVAGVASIASMLRADYAVSSREVKLGTPPLIASVVRHLNAITPKVQVTVDRFRLLGGSPLLAQYGAVSKLRAELESLRAYVNESYVLPLDRQLQDHRTELNALSSQLAVAKSNAAGAKLEARLTTLYQTLRKLESGSGTARSLVQTADAIAGRFDTFVTNATATPSGALYPPLVAAALREGLHSTDHGFTHVLYVGVEGAGGEVVSEHAPIWKGDHLDFMGGCDVYYVLYAVETNLSIAGGSFPLMSRLRWDLGSGESKGVTAVEVKTA